MRAILQDRRGFLWFGTYDGLNRYDGYSFKVYRSEPGNPDTLIQKTIYDLVEDAAGHLWIGTAGGLDRFDEDAAGDLWLATSSGVNRFERSTGRFVHYPTGGGARQAARAILPEPGGVVWIGTESNGLARLDVQLRGPPQEPVPLSAGGLRCGLARWGVSCTMGWDR